MVPLILSGAEPFDAAFGVALGKLRRSALSKDAAPVLSRHPGLDPGPRNTALAEPETAVFLGPGFRRDDDWDRALARFQAAQAVLDSARSEPDQGRYDALLDSHSEALAALLALPAPDPAALAAKLDVIVPHFAWELTGSEDCLERLRRDAYRLAAIPA